MKNIERADSFIKNLSFWEHLTDDQKSIICENTIPVTYKKGDRVHSGNANCVGVLFIKKGQLRTYMLSEDGREITLYRLFNNDVCILSASCVLDAITFDVFIDAEEDTDVLLINSAIFRQIAKENVYMRCFAYQLTTTRFSEVMWAMQQILFMGADKRLAIFLLDEIAKTGKTEINLTHEQIAKYMGSAREVVSRLLKYFEEESIVKLHRGGLEIIDKKKLQALV